MQGQSKATMRAMLQELVAAHEGAVHRDSNRVTIKCPICHLQKQLNARFITNGCPSCQRCGAKMQLK